MLASKGSPRQMRTGFVGQLGPVGITEGASESNEKIETKEDVINQLMHWLAEIGLGFPPDTPGNDYVTQDGTMLFTEEQASEYDLRIQVRH
jgi:hypothetical protein